jgi:cardiolipin synthase
MNIADRYVESIKGNAPWRDTHFRVRGAIINSLLYSFASDWSYMGRPLPTTDRYLSQVSVKNNVGIQLITSGPDSRWPNIALAYHKAISGAKKSIFIQTPYFLPTDDLLKGLQTAALSQVDVRIMIPRHSDSYLLNWASFSYVAQCLQAGIKIYLYENRMIHSKMMIIDDDMISVGSANFDFRSFEHNFESNIFVFDRDFNSQMREIFFKDLTHCTKLTYTRWRHRPFTQKVMESIVRLLSPIL